MRRRSLSPLCHLVFLTLGYPSVALADELPAEFRAPGVEVRAWFETRGANVTLTSDHPRLIVSPPDLRNFRVELEVELAPGKGKMDFWLAAKNDVQKTNPASSRISVTRDVADSHSILVFTPMSLVGGRKWTALREERRTLELAPHSWRGRFWKVAVERSAGVVRVLFDGQTLVSSPLECPDDATLVVDFEKGDRIRALEVQPPVPSAFVPIELGMVARPAPGKRHGNEVVIDGVPFRLSDNGRAAIDLRRAGWPDWQKDPGGTVEAYDLPPTPYADPRRPMLWARSDDYVAAHVLATTTAEPNTVPIVSLTFGAFGKAFVRHYVSSAAVPRTLAPALSRVRIPLGVPLSQEIPGIVQLAPTKEVRLAVRQTDPSRFRYRPLGLPSNVRIYAITLERSPIRMQVTCDEPGCAFLEPKIPSFRVTLENVTSSPQRFIVNTVATHIDGQRAFQERTGEIAAGAKLELRWLMPVVRRGYYDYRIELQNERKERLLVEPSSFALLAADTRKNQRASPFGTWDFSGGHATSRDATLVGTLYKRLGFRYGMFRFTAEERARFGVVQGREPVSLDGTQGYQTFKEKNPDAPPVALLMHEHGLSSQHILRAPDLFDGRARYLLDAAEQKRLDELFAQSTASGRAFREQARHVHLRLGNGALPTKEEFYRRGFPSELFDSAGNEAAAFGRPPEAQPPDYIAMNASLWMDRRLLDHYGYAEKPVTQCFETCFPATSPGNLSFDTQASYLVRHALHALAWRIPEIRLGMIMDAGDSYYSSNWGASGLATAMPDVRVKPSFVALSVLTTVLDGSRFSEVMDLGSASLYGLAFDAANARRVHALWTLRGRRDVTLDLSKASGSSWTLTDSQGNETSLHPSGSTLAVTLGPSPIYLAGIGRVERSRPGKVNHDDAGPFEPSSVVSPLDDLDDWTVETERDFELEFHNSITPRLKGNFSFTAVTAFEGHDGVLQVTPNPTTTGGTATTPMYGILRHRKGLLLPGKPTAIGLWVNGNSSFGRVIFDLEDARGERWISIGKNSDLGLASALLPLVPKKFALKARIADWNTDDVFGLSRFDFDGWRYVSFPLPGNYPGEGYGWPGNSQWLHDGDGRAQYPLKLRRLIVELPQATLHVTTFAPVPRPSVYLDRLIVEQGPAQWLAPEPEQSTHRNGPFR